MKRFTSLYYIVFSALLMLTACQNDETAEQGAGLQPDGKVRVHLRVGAADSQSTRAWSDETYAVTAEMMNVWTVVVVDNSNNKVVSIYACKPFGEPDQEIDDYVELPGIGTYRFYSFANMSPKVVMSLLGISGEGNATVKSARTRGASAGNTYGDTSPQGTGGNENNATGDVTPYVIPGAVDDFVSNDNSYLPNTYYSIAFAENATVTSTSVEAKTVNVAGNNFDVSTANGYGAFGIPMSNVQTIPITEETTTINLIVIRLMAKFELQVYNNGSSDVTIKSITLMDVTRNADDNLKLLPNLSLEGHGSMEVTTHGDIQPNLGIATTANLTLYPTAAQGAVSATGHKTTDATPNPVKFTFYVNESATPTNASGLFYLTLGIKEGSKDVEYRHALISNTAADEWSYIARNDYRIIPIVLTDWQFRIEPIAFTPIAGYPATTLSSDALKATFSTGGFIALKPYVKKRTETYWRDFSDPEVTFVSIHWKNIDGTDVYGDGLTVEEKKIVKTAFTYDDASKYIIGELNQNRVTTSHTNKTAITVTVKLGPTGSQYTYSFTCDVVL